MLYIDCGHTAQGPHYTGIQRYVRRTLREASALLGPGAVQAVTAGQGRWRALSCLPAHPMEQLPALHFAATAPRWARGNRVLLADRYWHTGEWDALGELLAGSAEITVVIYDLLSLRHPEWFPAGVGENYARYLRRVVPRAERVVCLSSWVGREVVQWAQSARLGLGEVRVVRPGHQVWAGPGVEPLWLPPGWRDGSVPFFLQVGTLEPRKNHLLTLQAMELLWNQGLEVGCLFIGQRGWLDGEMLSRIESHPDRMRRLRWVSACTDPELQWCYQRAAAVCYPSVDEGYGLPLAEAAAAGAGVVAADTAVHREVVAQLAPQGQVRLCELSPAALSGALSSCLAAPRHGQPDKVRTWRTATGELLAAGAA